MVLFDANFAHHQALMAYVKACGWGLCPLSHWADVLTQVHHNPPRLLVVGTQIPVAELSLYLQHLRQMTSAQGLKVVVMQDHHQPDFPGLNADAYLVLPLTIPKLERILSL